MEFKGENYGLYLSGGQVLVQECNIAVSQPTIKQIVMFGEDTFLITVQLLGHAENYVKELREGNSQLSMLSDFQLLLVILREDPQLKRSIKDFFELVMPNYEISIEDASIDFLVEKQLVGQLTPFNFEFFQNILLNLFEPFRSSEDDYHIDENNKKAKEIYEKLKAGREKRAKLKNLDNDKNSMYGTYISILAVGLNRNFKELYDYTPFQLNDCFMRYIAKNESDFYQKVATTPFMDVSKMKQPKQWTENLYK